jgi:serine/threonine protein kinase
MGVVFRALDLQLARDVAVKVLSLEPRPEVLARIEREARLMAAIRHPHVIEIYDYGMVEGQPYLVLELLEGKDLNGLATGEDPLPHLLAVAEALDAVHQVGVLHRDVKPGNILVAGKGRTVLTDFGLAFDPEDEGMTKTGTVLGTVAFMSPEALAGARSDSSVDWWAWGVSLYSLLEGRLPFSWEEVMGMGAGGEAIPLPKIVRATGRRRALIERCLSRDLAKRPQGFAAIQAILEPGLHDESSPTASPHSVAGTLSQSASTQEMSGSRPRSKTKRKVAPWTRRRLSRLGVAFFLALGWWLLPGKQEPVFAPKKTSPSISKEANLGPFGETYLDDLRKQFRKAGRMYWRPDGGLEEYSGGDLPDDWKEFLSLDPALWGVMIEELSLLAKFRGWLQEGGRLEALGESLVRALRKVDVAFRDQGLPRPFFPFLYLSSPGVNQKTFRVPAKWIKQERRERYAGWELSGWGAVAGEAYRQAVLRKSAMCKEIEDSRQGRPTSEVFPRSLATGRSVLALQSVENYQGLLWRQVSLRRSSAAWSRPLGEFMHGFFYAAMRSLEEEDAEQPRRALLFAELADGMRWWSYTYLAQLHSYWILGGRPVNPGQYRLELHVLKRQRSLATELGWPRKELDRRRREVLQVALQILDKSGTQGELADAFAVAGVEIEADHGGDDAVLQAYRLRRVQFLNMIGKYSGRSVMASVLWAGKRLEGKPAGLQEAELSEILDWFDRKGTGLAKRPNWRGLRELLSWGRHTLEAGKAK